MICPNCGKANEEGAKFCNSCGKEFKVDKKAVICPSCGTEYSEMATFCGICGKELPKHAESMKPAEITPTAERRCKWCGAPVGVYDVECPTCKRDLRWSAESAYSSQYAESGDEMYTTDSSNANSTPVIGGVLVMIAGVLGLFEAFVILWLGGAVPYGGGVTCCGLLMLLFAFAGLAGGFFAATRSHFVLAIIGSVLVMACIGPLFLSVILGLVGLILIAISKEQFD